MGFRIEMELPRLPTSRMLGVSYVTAGEFHQARVRRRPCPVDCRQVPRCPLFEPRTRDPFLCLDNACRTCRRKLDVERRWAQVTRNLKSQISGAVGAHVAGQRKVPSLYGKHSAMDSHERNRARRIEMGVQLCGKARIVKRHHGLTACGRTSAEEGHRGEKGDCDKHPARVGPTISSHRPLPCPPHPLIPQAWPPRYQTLSPPVLHFVSRSRTSSAYSRHPAHRSSQK